MKKKGLAVFMAMVLSGISLCGCGGDGGNAASNINVGGSDNGMAGGQVEGMTSETFNGDGGLSYDVRGDMDLYGEIPAGMEHGGVQQHSGDGISVCGKRAAFYFFRGCGYRILQQPAAYD